MKLDSITINDRISEEYLETQDRAEVQGFEDGKAGRPCRPMEYKFFGVARAVYGTAYKLGKAARS